MRKLAIFTSLPEVGGHTTITLGLVRLCQAMFDQVLVVAKEMPGQGTSKEALDELEEAGAVVLPLRGRAAAAAGIATELIRSRGTRPHAFLAIGMRHLSPVLAVALRPHRSVYYHITHEIGTTTNRMLRSYSRHFDAIAFISPATERAWASAACERVTTLSVPQPSEVHSLREVQRGRPPGEPICFGFVGRLNRGKGCDVLLQFAKSASARCTLRVAGAGEADLAAAFSEAAVRRVGSVKVVFDGSFSVRERPRFLAEFFSKIDYLIVPSQDDREGIPTVILEALQAGVPVVATRTGGMWAFDYPAFGWPSKCVTLVDKDDVITALQRLAACPRPSQTVTASCRTYYATRFSDDALQAEWQRVLLGSTH